MDRLQIDLTKFLDETALINYTKNKIDFIKYKDLLKQSLKINLVLEDENVTRKDSVTVGIVCKKSPAAISLIMAILEADLAFCFITERDFPHELDKLGIKYFFSDEILFNADNFVTLRNSFDVFGTKIRLYKSTSIEPVRIFDDCGDPLNRICYTISTSGTTGQRKIVRVTYNCIASNVVSLQGIFQLRSDVIYSSAPCTFDVFVLDLFLALHSGSAVLIVDDNLRYSEESLEVFFSSVGVTFMQITPSLFQQYGIENIQRRILHPESSLRFLVLGGEQFPPTKEVSTWQDWDSPRSKRIFNIYGTTEVSCWATIHEVTKSDLEAGEVPLGKLLDQTSWAFQPDLSNNLGLEELILTSTSRICFVDDKKWDRELGKGHLFAQITGDLVRRVNGQIYYYGRRNEIVKKFGERVNLSKVEITAQEIAQPVACIYMKKKIVLFYLEESQNLIELLKNHMKIKLKPSEVPDDYRMISFFPLSDHGKVSKQQLKEIYKDLLLEDNEKRIEAEESFLEAINQILNLKLGLPRGSSDEPDGKRMRTDIDSTFKALGGTSFDALRISMRLEDQTGLSNGLLPKLLGDRHSIRDICSYLKEVKMNNSQEVATVVPPTTSTIVTHVTNRFDLKKCVDASPAITGKFISVGSHSHELVTIDLNSLEVVSTTELPDRIESEVSAFDKNSGLVGCYDGCLYCFDFASGGIKWKFNSQGMIKSKALVVGDLVIFGNYNYENNLWCIRVDPAGDGVDLNWKRLVGSRGILSAPLLVDSSSIIICTLDGTLEKIKISDGSTVWTKNFESPIFSTPRQVPGRSEIILAEVSKKVHCVDFDGNLLWSFETSGHIFSSFLFHQTSDDVTQIFFGCHDKHLRCLNYKHRRNSLNIDESIEDVKKLEDFKNSSVTLAWTKELQSQIYGTPRMIEIDSERFVISCATNGFVNFVKASDGSIEHSHKLPGEVFSTPVVHGRNIFVGCRDNFLYCLKF